jgi:hypothetical protein
MKWIVLKCGNLKNKKKIYKRKKKIFMANEKIIRRISFIDGVNMKSEIMILIKFWYEWINLIKAFEWEKVHVYLL